MPANKVGQEVARGSARSVLTGACSPLSMDFDQSGYLSFTTTRRPFRGWKEMLIKREMDAISRI